MMDFKDFKKLKELKMELADAIDAVDYTFTEQEIDIIIQEIEKYPVEQRTQALWQHIARLKTGVQRFSQLEHLEFSDINYIHQQIQALLNK